MRDIDSYSNDDIINEVRKRGYTLTPTNYDFVDTNLFEDIVNTFDSLLMVDKQKLRDLVIKFKEEL